MPIPRKRTGKKGTSWQVRYKSKATATGYGYKSFRTRKEAQDFVESLGSLKEPHAGKSLTVRQAVDDWLNICEKEGLNGREPVTRYTLANYRYRAELIKTYPWEKPIHELEAPDVVAFRSWLLQADMSREVARKVLASLQSVIKEMSIRGFIHSNVAAGISIRNDSRYAEPVKIPTKVEIKALLKAADDLSKDTNIKTAKTWRRYRPILYLAVDSGMRPQEYLALSHKALKKNGVQIDRAVDGSGSEITVTKTPAGRRFIELSPKTLGLVSRFAEKHSTPNDHDLVFPSQSGVWQCRRNWQRRGFNVACEKAGLIDEIEIDGEVVTRPRYRPYDLRHFYASMLIDKGVNLKKIQTLMGHSNIETTLNVYGHLLEDDPSLQVRQPGILGEIA